MEIRSVRTMRELLGLRQVIKVGYVIRPAPPECHSFSGEAAQLDRFRKYIRKKWGIEAQFLPATQSDWEPVPGFASTSFPLPEKKTF